MNNKYGPVAAQAECQTCGKIFDSYKNAQALAAQHAKNLNLVQNRGRVQVMARDLPNRG